MREAASTALKRVTERRTYRKEKYCILETGTRQSENIWISRLILTIILRGSRIFIYTLIKISLKQPVP